MQHISEKLQQFANSNEFHGFLKEWKAQSIVYDLVQLPDIMADNQRFTQYMKGCLSMEGFLDNEILSIQDWLINHIN